MYLSSGFNTPTLQKLRELASATYDAQHGIYSLESQLELAKSYLSERESFDVAEAIINIITDIVTAGTEYKTTINIKAPDYKNNTKKVELFQVKEISTMPDYVFPTFWAFGVLSVVKYFITLGLNNRGGYAIKLFNKSDILETKEINFILGELQTKESLTWQLDSDIGDMDICGLCRIINGSLHTYIYYDIAEMKWEYVPPFFHHAKFDIYVNLTDEQLVKYGIKEHLENSVLPEIKNMFEPVNLSPENVQYMDTHMETIIYHNTLTFPNNRNCVYIT